MISKRDIFVRFAIFGALMLYGGFVHADAYRAQEIPKIDTIVFVQTPDYPNGVPSLYMEQVRVVRRPNNARIVSLTPLRPDGKLTVLTPELASAIQPEISYDGKKILFSAKETPKSNWDVWEMNVDGSGKRQITRDLNDCIEPQYLPNGQIIFSSSALNFRDEYDRDFAKILHVCNYDGANPHRITFNLSADRSAIVLSDGRVLFTSWQHHGNHTGQSGVFAFATINPDGALFWPYTGNHYEAANTKSYAREMPDGRLVFVETTGHRTYAAGALTTVKPEKPLKTRQVLTPGIIGDGRNTMGRYRSPYPLPDGRMIVAYSPGRAIGPLRTDYYEWPRFGIYWFDFDAQRAGDLIFDEPYVQDYDCVAVYPRPRPPIIPSMVNDKKTTGTFLCLNSYLSNRKPTKNLVPGSLSPADPGTIKAVRLVEGFGHQEPDPNHWRALGPGICQTTFGNSTNSGTNFEQKRIIGVAPVEEDGSFHVEVPADTVINLQTLDEKGMAIETQLTWVWVRPGEVRICVGCHEDREFGARNMDVLAAHKPPYPVTTLPDDRRTVDFRRDIMPIIEAKCSVESCHDSSTAAGDIDLGGGFELVFHRTENGRTFNGAFFNKAYENLLVTLKRGVGIVGKYVRPSMAKHSPLIWRLYEEQLGEIDPRAPYKFPEDRTLHDEFLTAKEKMLFVEWIDIGAQWDNITGPDEYAGYNAQESRTMYAEIMKKLSNPIADPQQAFNTRCTECHDLERVRKASKTSQQWEDSLRRMVKKRPTWIPQSEVPIISKYLTEKYGKKK